MSRRKSGVLLHVTSLPSPYGIGDFGPSAYRFADFLFEARQGLWQILPLNPTDLANHSSPYHSPSGFACNPLLISPELLVREGLLLPSELEPKPAFDPGHVDYPSVTAYKQRLFLRAAKRFLELADQDDYERFCKDNEDWLDDFSLFGSLKSHFQGKVWSEWPESIRDRESDALKKTGTLLEDSVRREKVLQFLCFKQWQALKAYCNEKGIRVIGDIPIYTVYDSADVWVLPHLFNLDEQKRPLTVAGVPPDYFSETGQLWGNPVYRWDVLQQSGYEWWFRKIVHCLSLYDLVRIDHFRGFVAYWQVPFGEPNAVHGEWIQAPAMDFFELLASKLGSPPIIAEDLGTITPDVVEVMNRFGFPGMKVLLFAFGGDSDNPYLPHNYTRNSIVYTGTHDNNTVRGWFEQEASEEELRKVFLYLGGEPTPDEIHWELIRLAMMSVAEKAVFPLQDILGLGAEGRMNRPGVREGNWQWRSLPGQITRQVAKKLEKMTEIYGRGERSEK